MSEAIVPRTYQQQALALLAEHAWSGVLHHCTGAGKTFTALWAARTSGALEEGPVLVVAPLRTHAGWVRSAVDLGGTPGVVPSRILSQLDHGRHHRTVTTGITGRSRPASQDDKVAVTLSERDVCDSRHTQTPVINQPVSNFFVHVLDSSKKASELLTELGNPGSKGGEKNRGIYIVGWEYARAKNYTTKTVSKNGKTVKKNVSVPKPFNGQRFSMLIMDEMHRGVNHRGLSFDVMTHIAANRRIGLSATPVGNKPVNLFGAINLIEPRKLTSFYRFGDKYFYSHNNPWSDNPYSREYTTEKEPGRALRECGILWHTVSYAEALPELPGVQTTVVEAKMTREQTRIYKEWKKNALAWLDGNPAALSIPATKDLRLRQATLGDMILEYGPNGEEIVTYADDCKSGKLDALQDILSDLPDKEPIIVFCHSARFMGPLMHRLRKMGRNPVEVSGRNPNNRGDWERRGTPDIRSDDSRGNWEALGTPGGPDVVCATIDAIAEGVDGLQKVCHTEIWLSETRNYIMNQQAKGRLNRQHQDTKVQRYYIRCPGTIDDRDEAALFDRGLELQKGMNYDTDL